MPSPPMNDTVRMFVPAVDPATGEVAKDKYGRPLAPVEVESEARVKYDDTVIVTRSGQQVEAKLKIDLPATQEVYAGTEVEWTDRFGNDIEAVIESVGEVLNYSGKKVYWRKCYAT